MTVCVAYRVPGVGAVLAADGRISGLADGDLVCDNVRKLVVAGAAVCAIAGTVRPVWRRLQDKPPRTFKAFRDTLEKDALDAPEVADTAEWLAYDRGRDQLWYGPLRLPQACYAIGSGAMLALGALEALPGARTLGEAEARARAAIRVAIKLNVTCGGRVRVLVVPRRGPIIVR